MFRKGAPMSLLLSAVCSAIFTYRIWIKAPLKNIVTTIIMLVPFLGYLLCFTVVFLAIYDIIHKINVKYSGCLLGGSISAIIALTLTIHNSLTYSSIYLAIISCIALISFGIFMSIALRHEKDDST